MSLNPPIDSGVSDKTKNDFYQIFQATEHFKQSVCRDIDNLFHFFWSHLNYNPAIYQQYLLYRKDNLFPLNDPVSSKVAQNDQANQESSDREEILCNLRQIISEHHGHLSTHVSPTSGDQEIREARQEVANIEYNPSNGGNNRESVICLSTSADNRGVQPTKAPKVQSSTPKVAIKQKFGEDHYEIQYPPNKRKKSGTGICLNDANNKNSLNRNKNAPESRETETCEQQTFQSAPVLSCNQANQSSEQSPFSSSSPSMHNLIQSKSTDLKACVRSAVDDPQELRTTDQPQLRTTTASPSNPEDKIPYKKCKLFDTHSSNTLTNLFTTQSVRCTENNCGKSFQTLQKLFTHKHTKHAIKRKVCLVPKCRMSFETKSDLNEHIKACHSAVTVLSCSKCDYSTQNHQDLCNHDFFHHDQGNFKCSAKPCSFVGVTRVDVLIHYDNCHELSSNVGSSSTNSQPKMVSSSPAKPTKVDASPAQTPTSSRMHVPPSASTSTDDSHKSRYTIISLRCMHEGCKSDSFPSYEQLHNHNRVKHSILKYICHGCRKSFESKSDLGKHIYQEHFKAQWRCHLCAFALANNQDLNRHIERNHRRGQFKCNTPRCYSEPFNCRLEFWTHYNTHHATQMRLNSDAPKTSTELDRVTHFGSSHCPVSLPLAPPSGYPHLHQ